MRRIKITTFWPPKLVNNQALVRELSFGNTAEGQRSYFLIKINDLNKKTGPEPLKNTKHTRITAADTAIKSRDAEPQILDKSQGFSDAEPQILTLDKSWGFSDPPGWVDIYIYIYI